MASKKGAEEGLSLDKMKAILRVDSDFCFVYGDEDSEDQMKSHFNFRTGLTVVDAIIGEGGLGSGKISEIYGPNRSGKSELAQKTAETFLEDYPKGIVVYFDEETSLDDKKLDQCPIFQCGRMIIKKAANMEAGFNSIINMMDALIASKHKDPVLIIFDSIASMATKEEHDNAVGKVTVAGQARVLSVALRKIRGKVRQTNAHLIFVNQVRSKVGGMSFGDKSESACGEALKFYSDYRIKMANIGSYRFASGGTPDGFKIKIKTIKNKRVPPLREVEVPLMFTAIGDSKSGMSEVWSLYDTMKLEKAITVKGGNCSIKGLPDTFKKLDWPNVLKLSDKAVTDEIKRALESVMGRKGDKEDDDEDEVIPPDSQGDD